MATTVGALSVDLDLNSASFINNLAKASDRLGTEAARMNKSLESVEKVGNLAGKAIGGFVASITVGAISSFVRASLDAAGGLGELSQQLGVSTKFLQSMQFAATQAGVGTEELETGLAKLTRTIGEADSGNKKARTTFDALGVSIYDTSGKIRSTDAIFGDISEALSNIEDPARRAAYEVDLFGKSGQKLDTILASGKKGLSEYAAAAQAAGMVLSDADITRADEAADKIAKLGFEFSKLGQTLSVQFAPAISSAVDWIDRLLRRLNEPVASDSWMWKLNKAASDYLHLDLPKPKSGRTGGNAQFRYDGPLEAAAPKNDWKMSAEDTKPWTAADAYLAQADIIKRANNWHTSFLGMQKDISGLGKSGIKEIGSLAKEGLADSLSTYDKLTERLDRYVEDQRKYGEQLGLQFSQDMGRAVANGENIFSAGLKSIEGLLISAAWDQWITKPITKAFGDAFSGAGSGGGFLGSIFSAVGSLFGFGGGRASGGDIMAGKSYLVGEAGPEIITSRANSTVIANGDWQASKSGPVNIYQTIRFDVGLESVDQRIAQAAPVIARAGRDGALAALNRGGVPSV